MDANAPELHTRAPVAPVEEPKKVTLPHDPALDLISTDWMTSPPPPSAWRTKLSEEAIPQTTAPKKPSLELNPQINPDSKLNFGEKVSIGDGGASWSRTTGYDPTFRASSSTSRASSQPQTSTSLGARWKKEEAKREDRELSPPPASTFEPRVLYTGDAPPQDEDLMSIDLNTLKSQIMRAKLQKKMDLVASLESKLERARKAQSGESIDEKPSHVRVIDDLDEYGRSRSATTGALTGKLATQTSGKAANPRTSGLHSESGERLKYFADDDQVDLDTLVARERLDKRSAHAAGAISAMDAHYAENVMRSRNYKEDAFFEKHYDGDGDVDYAQWESREKKLSQADLASKEKSRAIQAAQKMDQATSNCFYCLKTKKIPAHAILAMGYHTSLIVPFEKGQLLLSGQVAIVPHEHVVSSTHMEESVWSEVVQFMEALTKYFESIGKVAVFTENVASLNARKHAVIDCYPVPKRDATVALDFFKKAIQETTEDVEWTSTHQRVLEYAAPKTIRQTIPLHFAYFMVQLGTSKGLAHHIEAKTEFPANFAKQVLGGLLQLDETLYNGRHATRRLSFDEERRIANRFKDDWRDFDFTRKLY